MREMLETTVRRFPGIPRIVLPIVFLTLISCGEPTGPTTPIGAYALSSIDAKPMPVTMYADTGYSLVFTAGTLILTEDLKYTWSLTSKETVDGNVSTYVDHDAGSWTQATTVGAITLTSTFGGTLTATWSGTTLTITQADGVFIYSKGP